jgi:tetratricopeptide (TPR) repeat protein
LFTKLDFLNRNEEHAALALCYDTWVKRNPDRLHPAVLYNQAVANLAQGKNDEASRLFREALVLEPDFEQALHAEKILRATDENTTIR